jgi:hypothetical protein
MGFEVVRRRGGTWEDAKLLDSLLNRSSFNLTGKSEREFESSFAGALSSHRDDFKNPVITQMNKEAVVQSVYCFGKKHRPDMTIGESGVAIEMKLVHYEGLKDAIGQGHLYRLRYKFVFLVLIVREDRKDLYFEIENGQEKDLMDTLQYLAENLNIFTYLVPAFTVKQPGVRKVISTFPSMPVDE